MRTLMRFLDHLRTFGTSFCSSGGGCVGGPVAAAVVGQQGALGAAIVWRLLARPGLAGDAEEGAEGVRRRPWGRAAADAPAGPTASPAAAGGRGSRGGDDQGWG